MALMVGTQDTTAYVARRRLLAALVFVFLLVAALFGAHTPSAGYDNDDPNQVALADFPRLALHGTSAWRGTAPHCEAAQVQPQAVGKPHEQPGADPDAAVLERTAAVPRVLSCWFLATVAPRAPPRRVLCHPAPRGPPLLA
jgi:hypothetical protein